MFKSEDLAGHEYSDDPETLKAYLAGHADGEMYHHNMTVTFVHPWVAAWRALMRPMRWRRLD